MPTDPQTDLTKLKPRDEWRLADKARTNRHLEWASDMATHEMLRTALAEYAMTLTASVATDAAAHHYRLEGAKAMVGTILTLGLEAKPVLVPKGVALEST